MVNLTDVNLCPHPFYDPRLFDGGGYVEGRICQRVSDELTCCLPCPMAEWVYPDSFDNITTATEWLAALSVACCALLLASWAFLPVEKTSRHYLSVSFTFGVLLMNLGFIIPLAAQPAQCFDQITPNDMHSSKVCGASGTLLLLGGWCGVMWSFLRSFSLHLQICWQVIVGRSFMLFAHGAGWGVPVIGIVLALVFSGVSFRFGATCHINHANSLAVLWVPLLVFAAATVVITFATFGYCVKVYLASLLDSSASTQGSGLPSYATSLRKVSPRQAYGRVRRVIALQWRGLAIVLIIIADVIFFSIVFVFQDHVMQSLSEDPGRAEDWILCLIGAGGNKNKCLDRAQALVVSEATVAAVLSLLALNGIWLLFLLGRWSMVIGWKDVLMRAAHAKQDELESAEARYESKRGSPSYELLSKGSSTVASPLSPMKPSPVGPRASDYFAQSRAKMPLPLTRPQVPQKP
ncbi:hypothetical protein CDD82_944 [Ophiocordyceps australis]|uniref:G-protein coupled receptors family 2 profile 2 domain-containing protein n=1 Tax=Ophiocordyceps australis TaxID=1399860 RepID=A0A2C5YL15_9HYPO|nr:hypothetical protein CDD82_944 [Ophiocordyceps australis]